MSISLIIHQQPAGTVTVSQEGLYTVLEARAPSAEGFVRLWAQGGGKSAYLGLMQPTEDGLILRRRLSRRELAAFPQPIEAVSDREQDAGDSHKEVANKLVYITENNPEAVSEKNAENSMEKGGKMEQADSVNDLHKAENTAGENPEDGLHKADIPEGTETGGLHKTETGYRACPWPAGVPEEGLLWYSRADGSLTAFDGISSLLALPAELRAPDAHTVERVIEGRKYLIFRC